SRGTILARYLSSRAVLGILDGEIVPSRVLDFVERPQPHNGLALRLDSRIGINAILRHRSVLAENLEARRSRRRGGPIVQPAHRSVVREDLRERFALGAIFGTVRAISTVDRDEPLPVEAE